MCDREAAARLKYIGLKLNQKARARVTYIRGRARLQRPTSPRNCVIISCVAPSHPRAANENIRNVRVALNCVVHSDG